MTLSYLIRYRATILMRLFVYPQVREETDLTPLILKLRAEKRGFGQKNK
jgi:hypothetical protein